MKKGSGRLILVMAVLLFSAGFLFLNNLDFNALKNEMRFVRKEGKDMIRKGLDLKGGVYAILEARPTKDVEVINDEVMDRLIEVVDRRVNGLGVSEANVQRIGEKRVVVELPGYDNPEEALSLIGKTALLEFKLKQSDGTLGETVFTGSRLKKAEIGNNMGVPEIRFTLDDDGAKEFYELTKKNIGKQLAIVLDGVEQMAPVIKSPIQGGSGVISGSYTLKEAQSVASLLNAGALPVNVEVLETRVVGATLGEESINKSMKASYIAVILVMVFMIVVYKLSGFVANIALICFGIVTFGMLNFFGATLTLPGIAGFILSVGMAVDANVIIFERIKEEMKAGMSMMKAIDLGFEKAMSAIVDSNITTLLIMLVLFVLGTGPVKGFAVTLTIGILASMFTAIVITKMLLKGILGKVKNRNPKFLFMI